MLMNEYLILGLVLYILPYLFYLKVSHGLGHKAEYLQLRRFFSLRSAAGYPFILCKPAGYKLHIYYKPYYRHYVDYYLSAVLFFNQP